MNIFLVSNCFIYLQNKVYILMGQLKYGQGMLKLHDYCDVKEPWIKKQPNKKTKKHKTATFWFEGLCPSMFPSQLWI